MNRSALAQGESSAYPNIIIPASGEKSYQIAGKTFAEMWSKVTGAKLDLQPHDGHCPGGNIIVIGSDAVNPIARALIMKDRLESFKIRYGTDDYHIVSISEKKRTILVLAGGCGRSTIYAVYDFFRKRAGVEYFWDGDIIPKNDTINISRCDFQERPRFMYRGLRYFAHRGLHRFRAEHWNFEDWKCEIDWMLKKRFNIFMLRTGIDDLFQRTFPESVPYPPEDAQDPDAVDRSYDDRTSFWPLRYRGQLRKKVLKYAFDRGLLHPEDVGTITHWYSHTPSSFYNDNPDFPVLKQSTPGYNTKTGRVWDIRQERAWQAYWKLTQTHIKDFGNSRIFHTIGLAERKFGKTKEENFKIKLYTYRKIQEILRRHYPDASLLIASWDFFMYWQNKDVKRFLKELDPDKTIILDYAADLAKRKTYKDWGVYGIFPWIFGIFHAFACQTGIRGNYHLLKDRIQEADKDRQCYGLVFWPEVSHSDTFLLEYFADNSWKPHNLGVDDIINRYCLKRYPYQISKKMKAVWRELLSMCRLCHWGRYPLDPIRNVDNAQPHLNILQNRMFCNLTKERIVFLQSEYGKMKGDLRKGSRLLWNLTIMGQDWYENSYWRRDTIDIARTVLNYSLCGVMIRVALEMEAWRKNKKKAVSIHKLHNQAIAIMQALGDVLSQDNDFSLYASMKRLGETTNVNPYTEQTLKSNTENDYCRGQTYELVRFLYPLEYNAFFEWVGRVLDAGKRKEWRRPAEFNNLQRKISDKFYATPLKEMAPIEERSKNIFMDIFKGISKLMEGIEW